MTHQTAMFALTQESMRRCMLTSLEKRLMRMYQINDSVP
jgi:hypothetical protein